MIDRIEFELQQCVENRCRPDLNDIDAANLLAGIAQLRADLSEQCPLLGMSGEREARLMAQLAEGQAREATLRKALAESTEWNWLDDDADASIPSWIREAIAIPSDDSALREMIEAAKAEEREAVLSLSAKQGWAMRNEDPFEDAVREILDLRADAIRARSDE